MNYLKGKKTYISAGLIAIVVVLHQLGYIDMEAYATLIGLLGATGLASLRLAVK